MESILILFKQGGPLMWPIIGCSVLGLALFAERVLHYLSVARRSDQFFSRLKPLVIEPEQVGNAQALCQSEDSALARLSAAVLESRGQGVEGMRAEATAAAGRETVLLERYLGLLSTLATVSPLLGLLGTVLGMIEAFQALAAQGVGTPATLGGGISQALVTTAAGLSVAIPMVLLHRFLVGRVERLMLKLDGQIQEVIRLVLRVS